MHQCKGVYVYSPGLYSTPPPCSHRLPTKDIGAAATPPVHAEEGPGEPDPSFSDSMTLGSAGVVSLLVSSVVDDCVGGDLLSSSSLRGGCFLNVLRLGGLGL